MIKLIGVPYDENSSFLRGSAMAPARIRRMHDLGASNPSTETGKVMQFDLNIQDCGDLDIYPNDPGGNHHRIFKKVSSLIDDKSPLIVMGGDHAITFPVVEAFAKKYHNLHLLHFDAHSDLYDSFDRNPYSHASPFARIMEKNLVASLTQIGLRTLCKHQREQIERFQVRIVEMKDFSTDFVNDLKGPLYISIDLDVLDPAFVPGISHHEPGGLSTRQLINCLQMIKLPIVGADIVEYNPGRDLNDATAMVAYKLLKEIWAKM